MFFLICFCCTLDQCINAGLVTRRDFLKKKKALQILLFKNVWLVLYYIITYLYSYLYILLLLWHSTEAVTFFSLPVLALIFPACSLVSSHLLRDSLCTALQTERLWIWSTRLSTQLTPFGFGGTCEDIYLFGTMITGILLIGLGFALGYRRIQKTGTAV